MKKTRVVFMGTPSYATEIFSALLAQSDIEIAALFTQDDKKAGRGGELTFPHIKQFAITRAPQIPIFQPQTLKTDEITRQIEALKPDFIVVAAYGKLLPKAILDIAPCINLHASLLPLYRGASPIQQAILEDDLYSGVSAMRMAEGLDTGDMLGFSYVKIQGLDFGAAFELLSKKAAILTLKIIRNFDIIEPLKQKDALSSYAPKIAKEDGLVSFEMRAREIWQKFLAFTPWPGIFLKNGVKLKQLSLSNTKLQAAKIGEILQIGEESITIACKEGAIELFKVQAPSKAQVSAAAFANGQRIRVGNTFC